MILVLAAVAAPGHGAERTPHLKEGLLIRKAEAVRTLERLESLREDPTIRGRRGILTVADRAVEEWPSARKEIEPHLDALLDIEHDRNPERFVPEEARRAARRLGDMVDATAKLGFAHYLTGESRYARTAFEIIVAAGRVERWGWFCWEGVHVPQIPFGMHVRNVAFAVDFCWHDWTPAQQRRAVEILAEKGVEPYWRLVSLTPFMGLHHLRSKNQGSNVLGAALVASIAVGDDVEGNKVWFRSLLQTYAWIVAHDIGWAGTNLESGLPGYWSISMQNLYTAAAALSNARGIELRDHPAIAEATWYPIMKEATVPPHQHGRFDRPYPKHESGLSGTMEHKPIELPSPSYGGAWWYDFAARRPDSPATYFISKDFKGRIADAHQRGHAELMELLWVRTMAQPESTYRPELLFKCTDREAMFRSGYGSPHTFLSFNGDFFLSARNEILCCTSGLAWHFPWHQYAVTESVLETEGEPFSPSMVVRDALDGDLVSWIRSESGTSNVKYYPRPGQVSSHEAYRRRTRDIAYVRSEDRDRTVDYFLFVDQVEHDGARWHAFNWHIWSSAGNEGRYEVLGPATAIARRPNAAVLLATLSHERMSYEEQGIPSQPTVAYVFDHNARLLRAIAGASSGDELPTLRVSPDRWNGGRLVQREGYEAALLEDFSDPREKDVTLSAPLPLQAGCRYEVRLATQKDDARIYENFSWIIELQLLDREGTVLADAADAHSFRDPHPLKLTSPASNLTGYTEWKETTTHFTAPEGVASVRATFRPATYGHGTRLKATSRFWLGEMTFRPLGVPLRRSKETIVTLAVPVENGVPLPAIRSSAAGEHGFVEARVEHPGGATDEISVGEDGHLAVERHEDGTVRRFDSRIAKRHTRALRRNSEESRRRLEAGLEVLARRLREERDEYTRRGWKNIAREATEVRATASRDQRFPARNVIDNRTWELPIDGVVDYTIGTITTTGNGGYGRGAVRYEENLSRWPLYVPPTYWLLPPRQAGSITITLREARPIRMVRLLNTTNAGLNDFATIACRVALLDEQKSELRCYDVVFGKPWDRAFRAAFALPEFFREYGASFRGILEPGVVVPFGAGWQDVPIEYEGPVRHVRVTIRSYWALGGGLNEVQVYAAESEPPDEG